MGARRIGACCSGVVIPGRSRRSSSATTFMFIAVVDMSAMAGVHRRRRVRNFAIIYGYQQFNQQATWVTVAIIVVIVQAGQLLGNTLAQRILRRCPFRGRPPC